MINLLYKDVANYSWSCVHTHLCSGGCSLDSTDYRCVFSAMQNSCPPVGDNFGDPTNRLFWQPLKTSDIKWNFEKFLVGPDGKPVMRWHPSVNISEVRSDIRKYLLKLFTRDIFN